MTGEQIGHYRLDRCQGRGGFGLVFEAMNVRTGTIFAVKVLTPSSPGNVADFENEAVLLRKLTGCSSVIRLVDTGTETFFVQMPNGLSAPIPIKYHVLALASGDLEELVADPAMRSQLPWAERVRLWRGAIKGVHQMHLQSVAHRDLKSSNCLIMAAGAKSEIRIADLGRSKDLTQAPTLGRNYLQGMGDFRYAPPENLCFQAGSQAVDFKNADLYGLGSLLAELVSGHPMTALAVGSYQGLQTAGTQARVAGGMIDLATLRPQFSAAINQLGALIPPVIRDDVVRLLAQICDPVPARRGPQRPPGTRVASEPGLKWLLDRADILGRRLSIDTRRRPRYTVANRSA